MTGLHIALSFWLLYRQLGSAIFGALILLFIVMPLFVYLGIVCVRACVCVCVGVCVFLCLCVSVRSVSVKKGQRALDLVYWKNKTHRV